MCLSKMSLLMPMMLVCTGVFAGEKEPHSDIGVSVESGVLVTGSSVNGVFTPGARVFESELGEVVAHFSDEPGFNAPAGSGLPVGSTLAFNILDALRRFDPINMDFAEIPPETMTVSLSAASRTTPTAPDTVVTGFAFASVSGSGSVHQHLNFYLNPPQNDGVYALKLELVSSSMAIAPSEPFYIVFNDGRSEQEHELAVEILEMLLSPACPGDTNHSNTVDIDDLNNLLSNWLAAVGVGSPYDLANDDGVVDIDDLNTVLSNWQASCE